MRILMVFLMLAGSACAQQLFSKQNEKCPRDAESILIVSCRLVGERLGVPMPNPRVELRLGDKTNSLDSKEDVHVISLKRWNTGLFKQAAMRACYRSAEDELVLPLTVKVRDY